MKIKSIIAVTASLIFSSCSKQVQNSAYTVLNLSDFPYQSFVNNWDDEKQPVLCRLITGKADYDAVFGSAAIMGKNKPFSPSASEFAANMYILVSRVVSPSKTGDTFHVDSVVHNGTAVSIYYTFTEPKNDASYFIKDGFLLQLPKVPVTQVTIYENNRTVGEIRK